MELGKREWLRHKSQIWQVRIRQTTIFIHENRLNVNELLKVGKGLFIHVANK